MREEFVEYEYDCLEATSLEKLAEALNKPGHQGLEPVGGPVVIPGFTREDRYGLLVRWKTVITVEDSSDA